MSVADNKVIRWMGQIHYRTDEHTSVERFGVSELSELQTIVERGPHWETIRSIDLCRTGVLIPNLTIEQAEKL